MGFAVRARVGGPTDPIPPSDTRRPMSSQLHFKSRFARRSLPRTARGAWLLTAALCASESSQAWAQQLVSITPSTRLAFTNGACSISTSGVPNGPAALTLSASGLAADVVLPMTVIGNSATVAIPPLSGASAADVVASGVVSYVNTQGSTVASPAKAAAFTWNVPEILAASPGNAPYDQQTGVIFTLRDHAATSGYGTATFGGSAPQSAYLFTVNGQVLVSTIAPAQPAPGPVTVRLQFGSEMTLAQRGFVYLGPGITTLSATSGWQAGGENLSLELYDFVPGVPVHVIFGSGSSTSSVSAVPSGILASSQVSLVTPFLASSGALDLQVVQYAGLPNEKRFVSPGAWLSKAPLVQSVSPASGPQVGGTLTTIAVRGLPTGVATQVELGALSYTATNTGTLDASSLMVTTTTSPVAGPVNLRVTRNASQPNELGVLVPAGFSFVAPTLSSVLPTSGPREGGTLVVAQVSGFDGSLPATVTVGGASVPGSVATTGLGQTVSFRTVLANASGLSSVNITQGPLQAMIPNAFTFEPPRVSTYCQAKLSSAGTLPVIGFLGSPSVATDNFTLTLSNALPDKYCLYFFGNAQSNTPFYGGKLCVSAFVQRGPTVQTNGQSYATCAFDVTPALVGQNRYFQWWYRDPADPFSVGLSGGLRVIGFYP